MAQEQNVEEVKRKIQQHVTQSISNVNVQVDGIKATLSTASRAILNVNQQTTEQQTGISFSNDDNAYRLTYRVMPEIKQAAYENLKEDVTQLQKQAKMDLQNQQEHIRKLDEQLNVKFPSNQNTGAIKDHLLTLKEIAKNDFQTTKTNIDKQVEDTKNQAMHCFGTIFKQKILPTDFTDTTKNFLQHSLPLDINKADVSSNQTKSTMTYGVLELMSPLLAKKTTEDIEAEQMVKDKLLEYSENIKTDLDKIDKENLKTVEQTKKNIKKGLFLLCETTKMSDEYTGSVLTRNVLQSTIPILIDKFNQDIAETQVNVNKDVEETKKKIGGTMNFVSNIVARKDLDERDVDDN